MGGQIRRGWRFWGAPIFHPEAPKPFKNRYLGTSGLKSGRPKNAKSHHDGSDPPFAALWLLCEHSRHCIFRCPRSDVPLRGLMISNEWQRYRRRVRWTNVVQDGQDKLFGQDRLVLNQIFRRALHGMRLVTRAGKAKNCGEQKKKQHETALPRPLEFRKILVSVKFFVRNSGAGNGCANFMGAWKNVFFLQENRHVHKIPRFGGGGRIWGFGGECRFYFYGRGDFSDFRRALNGMRLVTRAGKAKNCRKTMQQETALPRPLEFPSKKQKTAKKSDKLPKPAGIFLRVFGLNT